ncbi:MAG: hypothetical protein AAB156_05635 [Pseudomonadota bacterium]
MTSRTRPHHPRGRRARIELPTLRGEEAVCLVDILETAINAIWRAYGDDMADYLGMLGVDMIDDDRTPYVPVTLDTLSDDIDF